MWAASTMPPTMNSARIARLIVASIRALRRRECKRGLWRGPVAAAAVAEAAECQPIDQLPPRGELSDVGVGLARVESETGLHRGNGTAEDALSQRQWQ
jgi:hypothetical protein